MKNFPKISNETEKVILELYEKQNQLVEFTSHGYDQGLFDECLIHKILKKSNEDNNIFSFTNFGLEFAKVLKNKHYRSNILKKMTLEDYLLAINYLVVSNPEINEDENIVSMTDIARYLGLSNSSISEYIRIIEKEGYIKVIPRKGVILTSEGLEKVYKVLETRNILVEFFNSILKIDLDLAEVESHVLEHNISPIVFERLGLLVDQLSKTDFSLSLSD